MPDWSYQTIFRPLLFRLSGRAARDFTLFAMGAVSKLPGGSLLIRTLGHMESYPGLKSSLSGIAVKYSVGVSGSLDIHGFAPRAVSQFGLGFMEVGPITLEPIVCDKAIQKDVKREAIWYPERYTNDGVHAIARRLAQRADYPLPLMVRTRHLPGSSPIEAAAQQQEMLAMLLPYASGLYLDVLDSAWELHEAVICGEEIMHAARALQPELPIFFYIPLDCPQPVLQELMIKLNFSMLQGLVIGEAMHTEQGDEIGKAGKAPSLMLLSLIKDSPRFEGKLIVTAGIHEPLDALELMRAGADYVQLHSGLVFSGPGLPKRINEAILHERIQALEDRDLSGRPELPKQLSFWGSWGWMYILGLSMIFGGILALIVAATSVVLPYDIEFLGIGSAIINSMNNKLLPFMSRSPWPAR
ncbi:hypothetical protein [Paenibacillus sp. GP183]|uniref:hypothetical protein n=1 Tax=Paenibacillus sp. GP183 TaxID=1882751 RepID=UPI0008979CC8|nr:hypothetical protein [Paenibacillus sp. GP183]SEB94376.1 Dihydroorotate dehydrogenase [Paenibacillus sp. GP183]